jgi:tetratricopeptide (TPR) repeat protein
MQLIKHFSLNMNILTIFFCGFLLPVEAAGKTCEQWAARVVSVQGVVEAREVGQVQWVQLKLNDTFCPGDMMRVKENSRAAVVLSNETNLALDQNTTITFTGIEQKKPFLLQLLSGAIHFFSRFPKSIKVLTPFVNASVEGTEGLIRVEEDKALLSIFEGRVLASNAAGSLTLTRGQSALATVGKAPVIRILVKPRDAVQWALYYPPVMYVPPGEAPKEDLHDPRFLAYRAEKLLAVGRVDQAGTAIEQALRLDSKYSGAYALESIIAVVQNEKEKALSSAKKAVEVGPNSATARIAMSYAQQASFDLVGARKSVEAAVKLDPNNALAWARLAELWSSFGNLDKALDAAKKAVELDPKLSRTQMVLGFAYLTQVKIKESKTAFKKAIELDQADPLSRLGLGLAKIRDGDLKAGASEIEIAASLDPNNSIIRSYLGKTYYAEKRTDLDGREYAIAKELDPNDPTPWFYDAIAKQTTNRPVEALRDLQKAIELNNNRAVYRSKLLLDSDLAARSSSLARIYNNLGFQQRGLVEGWSSVNTDPSNFSAHRLLADSYAALPRHEIARVSELLQSQLLQPINITPIQPALAESNLFLISAGGPAGLSFNEFNPLFNRNQAALQASGLVAENETWSGEGIVSGIYNKLSMSAGYSHFETDGWRDNADQNDDIANIFAQYELFYKTSIQAEYRYRDIDRGDTRLSFFEDDFQPNLEQEEKTRTFRMGFRQAFTPASVMIGNFALQDADPGFNDFVLIDPSIIGLPQPPLESVNKFDTDEDSYGGELQYLWRSRHFNMVSGAGYFNIDSDSKISQVVTWPGETPPLLIFDSERSIKTDTDHYNLYLYSYINPLDNVTFTVGASADFFDLDDKENNDRNLDKNKFNPKLGISWNPFGGTTLRGALFRTLTKTVISAQTIEPTQVAGFNQFFDEFNATEAWLYGVALDQKFTPNFYGGAELVYRNLDVPWFAPTSNFENANWEEYTGRAYLYYTPHNWFSLTTEYLYEKLNRDEEFNFGLKEVKTHLVSLGVNFFHPFGLNVGLKATYVNQDGDFDRQVGGIESGNDDFWLADAAISYRLPKRYGFITIGVKNLFDKSFEFADSDINNPTILPDRSIFGKITLSLP